MIQVASESAIALIHIAQIGLDDSGKPLDNSKTDDAGDLVSPTLRKIIESDQILKTGVNILGDARRLRDYLSLRPQGVFELSDLHNSVTCAENNIEKVPRKLLALSKQAHQTLGLPLDKGTVRVSDWTKPIHPDQIECRSPRI